MDTHVKVLGALQIGFGAFGLMAAVLLVFVFGGAAGTSAPAAIRGHRAAVPAGSSERLK